jgi:adenylate kinase family enzyme
MPDLRVGDPLPTRLRRVAVAGPSGCGKSTLARRIGDILELPYTDLDSLHHGRGRRSELLAAVTALTASPRWVCEFQYPGARRLIRERADVVVWLHLPRRVVLWRLLRRKLSRRIRPRYGPVRDWPGWDRPLREIVTDPRQVAHYTRGADVEQARLASRLARSRRRLTVVHLYSPTEVEQWVQMLEQHAASPARHRAGATAWPVLTPAP